MPDLFASDPPMANMHVVDAASVRFSYMVCGFAVHCPSSGSMARRVANTVTILQMCLFDRMLSNKEPAAMYRMKLILQAIMPNNVVLWTLHVLAVP